MGVNLTSGMEAMWHDKSHLSGYLLNHKLTKMLSPEDLWDLQWLSWPQVMKKLRFMALPNNHQDIRDS